MPACATLNTLRSLSNFESCHLAPSLPCSGYGACDVMYCLTVSLKCSSCPQSYACLCNFSCMQPIPQVFSSHVLAVSNCCYVLHGYFIAFIASQIKCSRVSSRASAVLHKVSWLCRSLKSQQLKSLSAMQALTDDFAGHNVDASAALVRVLASFWRAYLLHEPACSRRSRQACVQFRIMSTTTVYLMVVRCIT